MLKIYYIILIIIINYFNSLILQKKICTRDLHITAINTETIID